MLARVAASLALGGALAGCIPDAVPPPPTQTGAASAPTPGAALPFKRGVNVGNRLDAPSEGEWGVSLDEATFEAIAAQGFDHVRIPVRFNAHAAAAAPYAVDETFFRRVDWAVDQVQRRGMAAIVDFHHYLELTENPDAHADRFVGIWRQIAARYRGRPASVYYELLNEPNGKLTADKWNAILARALHEVRAVDPGRKVIVDSYFWAAAKELATTLVLPAGDPNLIGSFHTYQPILFTHQGASWMPPEFRTVGVVFPGPPAAPLAPEGAAASMDWVASWFRRYDTQPAAQNPSGPATLAEEFEYARQFAEKAKVPVYLGEFGVIDKADTASRVTWTRAVRKEAEQRGIPWTYWDDGKDFKLYDPKARTWNADLLAALFR
jgi:endoglucanase